MMMNIVIKKLNYSDLGIIEDSNNLITTQKFLDTVDEENIGLKYLINRGVTSEYFSSYFFIDDIYTWFKTYCSVDADDFNFIKIKMRSALKALNLDSLEKLKGIYFFVGHVRRNSEGQITGVQLRTIPFQNGSNNRAFSRVFFYLFCNNNTKKFELWHDTFGGSQLRDKEELNNQTLFEWVNIETLSLIKELHWNKLTKNSIDYNRTIYVTEGIYDTTFLDNSMSCTGIASAILIPEKLRKKDIVFILDNQSTHLIQKTNLNLIKMGYSIFKWPREFIISKDFGDYYGMLKKINKFLPGYSEPEFTSGIKNIIKKAVYSEENIIKGGDIKAYDEWMQNKYT